MPFSLHPDTVREFLNHHSRVENTDSTLKQAAVLLLLFPRADTLHVLLTKRTEDVEHHKGQISFPGGSTDATDGSVVVTALREAEEEVGIPPEAIEILGLFSDSWTPSGFRVTPVIGFASHLPPLRKNPREVEEVLEVPLDVFLTTENERVRIIERDGKPFNVYFYSFQGNEIWGATAAIMRSFLMALKAHMAGRGNH